MHLTQPMNLCSWARSRFSNKASGCWNPSDETESPWPLHFKHSHWWKRRSWSKLASHYAWGTNRVREFKVDVQSTWHRMDHVSWSLGLFRKSLLGGRPNTKPGDHGTPNAHNRWFTLFHHVRGLARIKILWNSVWLRTRSHMISHYTRGSVTTLHDFGGMVFGHFLLGSHNFMVTALGSWNPTMEDGPFLHGLTWWFKFHDLIS
jgi:hypothetical protein